MVASTTSTRPNGTDSSKTTASNSGTIAPFLNVPRSPPFAEEGQPEYSRAASAKLISPASIRPFTASASLSPLGDLRHDRNPGISVSFHH